MAGRNQPLVRSSSPALRPGLHRLPWSRSSSASFLLLLHMWTCSLSDRFRRLPYGFRWRSRWLLPHLPSLRSRQGPSLRSLTRFRHRPSQVLHWSSSPLSAWSLPLRFRLPDCSSGSLPLRRPSALRSHPSTSGRSCSSSPDQIPRRSDRSCCSTASFRP